MSDSKKKKRKTKEKDIPGSWETGFWVPASGPMARFRAYMCHTVGTASGQI